ncbi:HNH endonuclease [Salmonella enterica]|nr:HNH endonuclease [Salmonella enterica subsp. enterica serovar Oranienburg]ELL6760050.1 HNH endonuclease [Salmonella enterica]
MNWHELFRYDQETGKLFWKVTRGRVKAGYEAGRISMYGYREFRHNGKYFKSHRVIWDMFNPEDPMTDDFEIDHIDHNRLNNKLENLRKVRHKCNTLNMSFSKANTSGATGVQLEKRRNKWVATIKVDGVNRHAGYFNTFEEALLARKAAEVKYGFHENHGAKNEAQK